MSVFDEIVSVLNQINDKLGADAGTKAAAALPQPNNAIPKKEDTPGSFADKNADLVRGFRDALNSVPIFNKLAATLTGLTPLIDDLIKLVVAKKLFGGEKSTDKFANARDEAKVAWDNFKAAKAEADTFFDKINLDILHPDSPETKEAIKVYDEYMADKHKKDLYKQQASDKWTDAWENLNKKRQAAVASYMKNRPWHEQVGSGIRKLATGNGEFLLGSEMMAMAKIPVVAVAVGAALLKLAKSIADSQRNIAQYSPQMSLAFAMSDVRQIFRDIQSANNRAGATSGFLNAWANLQDKWRPLEDELVNVLLKLGEALADSTSILLDSFKPAIEAVVLALKGLADTLVWINDGFGSGKKLKEDEKKELTYSGKFKTAEQGIRFGNKQERDKGIADLTAERDRLQKRVDRFKELNVWKWFKSNEEVAELRDLRHSNTQDKIDLAQTEGGLQGLKNLESQINENPTALQNKGPEPDLSKKKQDNAFLRACDAAYDAAKTATEFYKKYSDKGVTGIEFMSAAATWNYDPAKDRAYEKLRPIHDNFRNVSGERK